MRTRAILLALTTVLALVITACAAPNVPPPSGAPAAPAAADAGAAAAPGAGLATTVAREKTLIIGFEGGPAAAPEQFGLNPSALNSQGPHQVMIESLYYLNYQTGELVPWLAAGPPEWNKDFTEVVIKLRNGIKWNDGVAFTADDIVFTINMLKANPTLIFASNVVDVTDVAAVDATTVKITLKAPDPRFVVNAFGVRIWGAVRIVPKHIWDGQDPNTFGNFDLAKGWPVWTGPYKLVKASASEFVFDRRSDWWASETGSVAFDPSSGNQIENCRSGGGGSRTRVRDTPERTSTSVAPGSISPAGCPRGWLPTGQASSGVSPPGAHVPSGDEPVKLSQTPHGPRG